MKAADACLNAHQEGHNARHDVAQDLQMRSQRAAFHNHQRPDNAAHQRAARDKQPFTPPCGQAK
jgi:hypothetical protein